MTKEFFIECPKCEAEIEFDTFDIDGLDDHITAVSDEAAKEAERQFDGMVDPDDLPVRPRMIHDLSQAVAAGNMGEARILLDRIAYELGHEHQEACEVGRFAKVPV
jgi:hypothetical protein